MPKFYYDVLVLLDELKLQGLKLSEKVDSNGQITLTILDLPLSNGYVEGKSEEDQYKTIPPLKTNPEIVLKNIADKDSFRICRKCGSTPSHHLIEKHEMDWHEGEIYCAVCRNFLTTEEE